MLKMKAPLSRTDKFVFGLSIKLGRPDLVWAEKSVSLSFYIEFRPQANINKIFVQYGLKLRPKMICWHQKWFIGPETSTFIVVPNINTYCIHKKSINQFHFPLSFLLEGHEDFSSSQITALRNSWSKFWLFLKFNRHCANTILLLPARMYSLMAYTTSFAWTMEILRAFF